MELISIRPLANAFGLGFLEFVHNPAPQRRKFATCFSGGVVKPIYLIVLLILLFGGNQHARADIGPENTLVVINQGDLGSRTVANHYIDLRDIPTINVIQLQGVPQTNRITLAQFKLLILDPILAEIDRRKLGNQVRAVAYSTGFPLEIDISEHCKRITDPTLHRLMTPVASLTGLTFHFLHIVADSPAYLSLTPNLYARMSFDRCFVNPFLEGDNLQFEAASEHATKLEYHAAAEIFSALFEKHREQPPLGILAALNYAKAGDLEAADKQLSVAIDAGWTSGEFLLDEPAFTALIQRPEWKSRIDSMDLLPIDFQPAVGFRGDRVWTPSGVPIRPGGFGVNYLLACCLGVTGVGGMTTEEIVKHLNRSALSDRQTPPGKFIFTKTADVRTTAREPGFLAAIKALAYLGYQAKVINSDLPSPDNAIAGLMIGTPGFSWSLPRRPLPAGCLADNLTSFGGALERPGQTKLTELLRAGAAMSSGTVTEPYANQLKFPRPMMHAHYAQGLTAIEAFYSSIDAPYQLLIVGEPMCRAFARPLAIDARWAQATDKAVTDLCLLATQKQEMQATLLATSEKSTPAIAEIEIFLDGHWAGSQQPRETFSSPLPTQALTIACVSPDQLSAGYHRIDAAIVLDDRIETRISASEWLQIRRGIAIPAVKVLANGDNGQPIVEVTAEAADAVELRYHGRTIGRVNTSSGKVAVTSEECGTGPVRLLAVAITGDQEVNGKPFVIKLK